VYCFYKSYLKASSCALISLIFCCWRARCSEAVNNDPRLPPGFPKPLPLDKEEIKQTDALIAEADGIIAKMDSLIVMIQNQ
jgi:hypothetical protein